VARVEGENSIVTIWNVLAHSLSSWELAEYFGTILVIVGAAGEYLAEFRHIPRDEPKRKLFEKRYAIVLIVGLAVELLGLVRTSQLNGQIIATLNEQAQVATKDAATANETAKTFESRIAGANARAKSAEAQVASANAASHEAVAKVADAEARIAEANRRAAEAVKAAETERLARLKIEERLAPRRMSAEQTATLVRDLKSLNGHKVTLFFISGDLEAAAFADLLGSAFKTAGLIVETRPGMILGTVKRGISFDIGKNRFADADILANALIDAALADKPVPANRLPEEDLTRVDELQVVVGPKP
jgi:hypothetical protein